VPIQRKRAIKLNSIRQVDLHNVNAAFVTYRGRRAVRLQESSEQPTDDPTVAILSTVHFKDGIVEVLVAGAPRPDAPKDMRGFVGIAFHVQPSGSQFECFFLRPTNGRADDQLRRNHSLQYMSHPDHPWFRLREENPGKYESYADLVAGAWTKVKIVVSGIRALLYINDAKQPSLIVNDLKLGGKEGSIGLWIGAGTVAHFSKLMVGGRTG
jgi:hypothetical protein